MAERQLLVAPSYIESWERLDARLKLETNEAIARLCDDPRHPGLKTKKWRGIDAYSARVTRKYRLIFARLDDGRPVLLWVDNHDEARYWVEQHRADIDSLVKRATVMQLAGEGVPRPVPRASADDPVPVAGPGVLAEMAERGFHDYFAALDEGQVKLVTLDAQGRSAPVFVRAGAGTGKTVVAIRRALHLAERPEPGCGPVLYLCFNQVLMRTVRETIDALAAPGARDRIEVSTFNHWSAEYLQAHGRAVDVDDDGTRLTAAIRRLRGGLTQAQREAIADLSATEIAREIRGVLRPNQFGSLDEYLDLTRPAGQGTIRRPQREAIWELNRLTSPAAGGPCQWDDQIEIARSILVGDRERPPSQAVLVDEGQDCSPVMVRLAKALVAGEEGRLMFFADPAQSIYPGRFLWARREIDPGERQRRTLHVPYRSTRQILALAASLYGSDVEMRREVGELHESDRDGPLPVLAEFRGADEELAFVAAAIRAELADGRRPWEIGVLTSTNARRDEARDRLAAEGVRVRALDRAAPDGASVSAATVHSAKGLDFASVYLLDVTPRDGAADAQRAQLYVALTRSSRALTIVCRPETRSPLLGDLDPARYRTHEGGEAAWEA